MVSPSIRGRDASASLKHGRADTILDGGLEHPRQRCLGLIEAMALRTEKSSSLMASEAEMPRPH